MFSSSVHHPKRGFTLTELCIVALIVFVLGAVLFPVFAKPRRGDNRNRMQAATNQKMIALGILTYIQDYDERYPPAAGYVDLRPQPVDPSVPPELVIQSWGPDRKLPDGRVVMGLLSPYMKSNQLYVDPKEKEDKGGFNLHYMYNDLLAAVRAADMPAPAQTVMTTDAENRFGNAGHALTLTSGPFEATFNRRGGCDAGMGATVGKARFRHSDGANFAFADGHLKWFKGGPEDQIFFPPRESSRISAVDPVTKQRTGPTPGNNLAYEGRTYAGTFHLK